MSVSVILPKERELILERHVFTGTDYPVLTAELLRRISPREITLTARSWRQLQAYIYDHGEGASVRRFEAWLDERFIDYDDDVLISIEFQDDAGFTVAAREIEHAGFYLHSLPPNHPAYFAPPPGREPRGYSPPGYSYDLKNAVRRLF